MGRNHPLVKEAEKIPFKKPDFEDPFSIYYDEKPNDYLVYNYDYVDAQELEHTNGLPIINHRENNEFDFLPTPLPTGQHSGKQD